ncbi:MAG: thioredoxin domain-containing protein [Kyrpidia tusciae]|nr:thioredoxin domain-containing protein [Kyrpidia tusciae]
MLMTPEKEPFFVGTYFPKHSWLGRPGLMDLLQRAVDLWETDRGRLRQTGRDVVRQVVSGMRQASRGQINFGVLTAAFRHLENMYDQAYGGFGMRPKFPRPHDLMFLLRYYARTRREDALSMVEGTLRGMWRGGIYDHLGFGFSRYSTDQRWLIPCSRFGFNRIAFRPARSRFPQSAAAGGAAKGAADGSNSISAFGQNQAADAADKGEDN